MVDLAKRCNRCQVLLSSENFWVDAIWHSGPNGLRSMCKPCQVEYEKDRRARGEPVHIAAKKRLMKKTEDWRDKNRARYLLNQKMYNEKRKLRAKDL